MKSFGFSGDAYSLTIGHVKWAFLSSRANYGSKLHFVKCVIKHPTKGDILLIIVCWKLEVQGTLPSMKLDSITSTYMQVHNLFIETRYPPVELENLRNASVFPIILKQENIISSKFYSLLWTVSLKHWWWLLSTLNRRKRVLIPKVLFSGSWQQPHNYNIVCYSGKCFSTLMWLTV